jgi:GDSL-like Lipase/Acylhydrolase family
MLAHRQGVAQEDPPPVRGWWARSLRRLRTACLYVLVTGSIFFAVGEVLSRAYNLPDRANGSPRRLFVASDDPHRGYGLRPGVETSIRGIPVRVNRFGLRGPEVAERPAPGVHRVLALGDSATFGEGLAEDDSFPAQLARELSARSGEPYEVLNSGVQGYNTENELAFFRTRGLALEPETVVVGFNLNDFDYAPAMGPLGILTRDPSERVSTWSPAHISEFYFVLRWLVITRGRFLGAASHPRQPGEPFVDLDRYVSALRKQYYAKPNDERWQTMVDSLHGLGAVAREHHLRLVIAIIPDGDQFGDPPPALVPQQKVLAICRDAGLDCIDLYPAFAAAGGSDLFLNIMHPNAAGQKIIARVLADHLSSPLAPAA